MPSWSFAIVPSSVRVLILLLVLIWVLIQLLVQDLFLDQLLILVRCHGSAPGLGLGPGPGSPKIYLNTKKYSLGVPLMFGSEYVCGHVFSNKNYYDKKKKKPTITSHRRQLAVQYKDEGDIIQPWCADTLRFRSRNHINPIWLKYDWRLKYFNCVLFSEVYIFSSLKLK